MSLSSVESLLKARNVVVDPEWSRSRMEEMASKPGDGVSARKRMRPTERALFDEWMESHLAVSALGSTESVPDSGVRNESCRVSLESRLERCVGVEGEESVASGGFCQCG